MSGAAPNPGPGHGPHGGGGHGHVDYRKINNAHHHGEEEEGEGPWLMSFADMVTLLMCFFILFFQTDKGNVKLQDPKELIEKLDKLQKVLGLEKQEDAVQNEIVRVRTPTGAYGSIDRFKSEVGEISKQLDLVFTVGNPQPGVIELTFLNTRFFESGSAVITPRAQSMVKAISVKLKKLDKDAELEVEGHTDADPIRGGIYPSNWELSGARAATVVRLLQENGLDPAHMRASGLAHYKPIVPEVDGQGKPLPTNKALNRRIIIRVKTRHNPDDAAGEPGKGETPTQAPKARPAAPPRQGAKKP